MIEGEIEALKFFLENVDFSRLRSVYPELSGADDVHLKLVIPEHHREMKIVYNDRIIQPEWRACYE